MSNICEFIFLLENKYIFVSVDLTLINFKLNTNQMQKFTFIMQTFSKRAKQTGMLLAFLLFVSVSAIAQDGNITGVVTGEDGIPLIGVNVYLSGTQTGTVTDMYGGYTIAAGSNDTIVFSYTGYYTQHIHVGSKAKINIVLLENAELLDEVVVVGYGSQKKSDITGSISVIDADNAKKNVTYDVAKMLQGQVANVSVQSAGVPGGFVDVKIRGITSFNNNQPLYVIDGMIIDNPSDFAPSDVESIQVLKDASAAAIYGVRGANGVVIITTKKGKGKKLQVTYKGEVGIQQAPKLWDLCDREGYQELVRVAETNAGQALTPGNDPSSPEFIDDVNTNWQDAAFRNGLLQHHSLNFAGGQQEINYSVNVDYFDNTTYFDVPQAYERVAIDANLGGQIGRFAWGSKIDYSTSYRDNFSEYLTGNTAYLQLLQAIPTMPVYDPNRLGGFGGADNSTQRAITLNVIGYNTLNKNTENRNRFAGNLWGEYEIIKGLKYKFRASADILDWRTRRWTPPSDLGWYYITTPEEASLYLTRGNRTRTIIDNLLTYDVTLGKSTINALVGYVMERDKWADLQVTGRNFSDEAIPQVEYAQDPIAANQYNYTITSRSFLSRLNYSYDNRYFATVNFRQDQSSLFPPENNTGDYWSFSGLWKINNEKWLTLPNVISALRLRGGYGQLGNNTIGVYDYDATVNPFAWYPFGGTYGNGTIAVDVKDPDIKWEDTKTVNAALEVGLWEDRFSFTAEYFVKKSTDLLADVPIPLSTGAFPATISTNAADVRNNGWEFTARYANVSQSGDFSYSIAGNFGTLHNEVLAIGADDIPISGTGSRTEVGRSIAEIYVYETEGIFQSQEEIDAHALQSLAEPGDVKFRDVNGDGVIDDNDRTFQGVTLPKYTYGLTFNANYKNFDGTIFFQGSGGNKIINNTKRLLMLGDYTNSTTEMLNYWSPDNTDTDIPRPVIGDPNENARFSDRFVEDGSYLRLQVLEIGYTIPITKYIESVRISLSGQNLLTFTKYSGADPDFTNNVAYDQVALFNRGLDNGSFPNPRGYFFGVQVRF
jgi:TonB-linked SusC/RagA family outer membrane protein